ncbi:MAG: beta-ketoacyl-[acyl-carrier-protein] synthase family protein [Candidatus Omnitrophica bacterium]|nr:beta-ketoacyl-[acyl-carrier-protein] synthase family protein [Candidatus Omnitrophota bacterium]
MKRRVVVTGLGVVSSIGIGKDEFWKNLVAGKSGISEITTFDTSDYPAHKGGEVKNFDPSKFIPENRLKKIGRASQFAIAATKMALEDAALDIEMIKNRRIGVIIGTTMADVQSLEQADKYWIKNGEEDIWPINVQKYPADNLYSQIGLFFGLKGPNFTIPTACSAGNYCIGLAFDLIKTGKIDIAIAGGADPISRTNFVGFNRLFAMAPDKCQPFDKNRKGMMVGEGCGIVILEELEKAKRRNAGIYAETLGYGLSCDATHMTAPQSTGMIKVMRKCRKFGTAYVQVLRHI